jgi:uncharacterized protein
MDYKKLILALVLLLGAYFGWQALEQEKAPVPEAQINAQTELVPLTVGSATLAVEIRDTDEERALGLSYREFMGQDEGMLFIFSSPQSVTFWMREMRFDLDMIWIRENKVVEIAAKVPAPNETDPVAKTITPKEKVDAVLEVHSGWAEKNGVNVGDVVSFSDSNI